MSRIIVSGSVAYDRSLDFPGFFADHFKPDKLHTLNLSFQTDRLSIQFGGTAGNVAYNLALLGETPEIIATAGNDFSAYRSHCLLAGIDPKTIRVMTASDEMTSSAYVFADKGDNQISAYFPGAGKHAYDTPVEVDGRAFAMVSAGCIEDMVALPAYYRQHSVRYLFDPGQQIAALSGEQLASIISGAAVLFATDNELEEMMEKTGWTHEQLVDQAENLVVTYGAKGSRVYTRGGQTYDIAPVLATAIVDTTGAGDGHRAGFIKGLLVGLPLDGCAKLGSVVASFVVGVYGTQAHKFTLEDVRHVYRTTYGEVPNI